VAQLVSSRPAAHWQHPGGFLGCQSQGSDDPHGPRQPGRGVDLPACHPRPTRSFAISMNDRLGVYLKPEGRARSEGSVARSWPEGSFPWIQINGAERLRILESASVTMVFACGADDGNRTRTASLGMETMPASAHGEQGQEHPYLTVAVRQGSFTDRSPTIELAVSRRPTA